MKSTNLYCIRWRRQGRR